MVKTFLFLFTIVPITSFSQNSLGVRIGLGGAYVLTGFEESKSLTNMIFSPSLAVEKSFKLGESDHNFSFSIEYAHSGYRFKIINFMGDNHTNATMRIGYVGIGSLFNLNLLSSRRKKNQLFFSSGGFFSYRAFSRWTYDKNVPEEPEDNINDINFGLIISFELAKRLSNKNIFSLDIRHSLGLYDIINGPITSGFIRSIGIGILYKFTMQKK